MFIPLLRLVLVLLGVLVLFWLIIGCIRGVGLHRFSGDAMVSLVDTEQTLRPVEQQIRRIERAIRRLREDVETLDKRTPEGGG